MPGPHPAVALVRSAVRQELGGPGVLVACSGGADSLALAAAVAFEASRPDGCPYGLVTVDHGLQPGSAEQAERVAALGYELGFDPVEVVRVEVGTAGGPEAAARTARYRALDALAESLDRFVLLGHTLDDQAETVLLGLARGSGTRSLAGMAQRQGRLLRPLLGVRRADTEAACREAGLEPWSDPHNADPSYSRSRLRAALGTLEDVLGPGLPEALARTAELCRADADLLDALAARVLADASQDGGLTATTLQEAHRALRDRAVLTWLRREGVADVSAGHVRAVAELVTGWRGQLGVDVPGARVVREGGLLRVLREVVPEPGSPRQD
ncbi:MAG TPA: tRNA lysidine(34) synthetase TilS [Propionibacteriaceae bacterium]|nr:tRNA lysidine(34) synthetase TilS [Propionibacteriaceae bacterium]